MALSSVSLLSRTAIGPQEAKCDARADPGLGLGSGERRKVEGRDLRGGALSTAEAERAGPGDDSESRGRRFSSPTLDTQVHMKRGLVTFALFFLRKIYKELFFF